ncbi:2Fe-2S iron-sulfur cluster binding domain-containing protein [Aestuariibacter sp. GS-14]|uniref:NADH:ubiquinone reductase (Na(+)-transporting) subunit F n=1 Tax=Aestuariibacter sp. GS-14 TaxID=2590670 RepID=UPI00112DEE5D|nr:phenol 2-monooxygenase domain-containing protein [Aestuariibacter sp. GS-14]TPV61938.1 2Fe-2S iron-sulfur cluster binding domain-containing protein [Aestuariibacter sp. GS-14]
MSFEVTIEPLGQTVEVDEGQTILDAALRAGIYLPHACCHGLCATCKIEVLEGEVDHGEASSFALMDFERDENKCLACCAIPESDLVIEAEIEDDPDSRNLPVKDYQCTVSRIEDLTPTIKGIWLKLEDVDGIDFQAGQYINLNLPDEIGSRAFSIASTPAESGEIELNIRKVPGGVGTAFIHEQLQVGDDISLSGPYGRFFVKKSAHMPMIFMAGGSGLSSPRSMIVELLEEGCDLPITLVYGQRTRTELYYHDEFLALAEKFSNFTYIPALSDPGDEPDWAGETGFVHEAAQRAFDGNFSGHKAYLCGPPLMIDACINTLMQGRLFERDIYTEKFISAADAQQVRSPLFKNI